MKFKSKLLFSCTFLSLTLTACSISMHTNNDVIFNTKDELSKPASPTYKFTEKLEKDILQTLSYIIGSEFEEYKIFIRDKDSVCYNRDIDNYDSFKEVQKAYKESELVTFVFIRRNESDTTEDYIEKFKTIEDKIYNTYEYYANRMFVVSDDYFSEITEESYDGIWLELPDVMDGINIYAKLCTDVIHGEYIFRLLYLEPDKLKEYNAENGGV